MKTHTTSLTLFKCDQSIKFLLIFIGLPHIYVRFDKYVNNDFWFLRYCKTQTHKKKICYFEGRF